MFTGIVRDITERKRLEKQILEIGDQERRRIGQDLHDDLGQRLAGIELMSEVLEQKLAGKSAAESARARQITRHVRDAIKQSRQLARGLSPVVVESQGLMAALTELAAKTRKLFQVNCRFHCPSPVLVPDHTVATHLYRITQEAVSNAVKHGRASEITIRLQRNGDRTLLTVRDNGRGFPVTPPKTQGMGLQIMHYRAGIIGAALTVEPDDGGGTRLDCALNGKPFAHPHRA
jgi:signal transduction histidine kinase